MASDERMAWERLIHMGTIPPDSLYSPSKAKAGHYTDLLRERLPSCQLESEGRSKGAPAPLAPDQKLAGLEVTAAELLNRKAPYAHRLPLLRASAEAMGISLRDQELEAVLRAARRCKANGGKTGPLGPGDRLVLTPDPWAWDGLILKGAFNLLIALPKVGKTSLALAWLDAWHRNELAFLDRNLCGPCPPVLIVGTDQGPSDWGRMLQAIGWVDEVGTIGGPLVGLHHAGHPLHLDGEGIDQIAEIAQQHPGLIVLIDSLAACIAPLGLKEESPQIVDPILDLMEQVSPYGATVVVIHHASKGRAGEGAAAASRGSTALPAAASQILKLAPASANETDPRRLLTTQGRGGPSQALVIQREGASWGLLGGPELLQREQAEAEAEARLTERQFEALREVRDRWEDSNQTTTSGALAEALGLEGTRSENTARKTLMALEQKGLLQSVSRIRPGLGGRAYEFWPTDHARGSRAPAGDSPKQREFGEFGEFGPLSREDPYKNNTFTSLAAQPNSPNAPDSQYPKAPRAQGGSLAS